MKGRETQPELDYSTESIFDRQRLTVFRKKLPRVRYEFLNNFGHQVFLVRARRGILGRSREMRANWQAYILERTRTNLSKPRLPKTFKQGTREILEAAQMLEV